MVQLWLIDFLFYLFSLPMSFRNLQLNFIYRANSFILSVKIVAHPHTYPHDMIRHFCMKNYSIFGYHFFQKKTLSLFHIYLCVGMCVWVCFVYVFSYLYNAIDYDDPIHSFDFAVTFDVNMCKKTFNFITHLCFVCFLFIFKKKGICLLLYFIIWIILMHIVCFLFILKFQIFILTGLKF